MVAKYPPATPLWANSTTVRRPLDKMKPKDWFSSSSSSSSSSSVVSIYPHRLLAFSQNVRPGEGSVPTGPTTGKLQSLMTSRAEKGTQDLMR